MGRARNFSSSQKKGAGIFSPPHLSNCCVNPLERDRRYNRIRIASVFYVLVLGDFSVDGLTHGVFVCRSVRHVIGSRRTTPCGGQADVLPKAIRQAVRTVAQLARRRRAG